MGGCWARQTQTDRQTDGQTEAVLPLQRDSHSPESMAQPAKSKQNHRPTESRDQNGTLELSQSNPPPKLSPAAAAQIPLSLPAAQPWGSQPPQEELQTPTGSPSTSQTACNRGALHWAQFSPLHSRAGKHLPALLAPLWETISFLGHQSTLLAHGQLLANHWLNIGLRLVEQHSAGVQPMGTIQPRLGLCVGLPKQQRGSTAGKGCGKGEVTSPRPMKTKGCELIAEPRAAPRLSPKLNCVCVQENTRCSSSRRVLPCSYLHGTQLMLTPSGRARKGGDGDRTGHCVTTAVLRTSEAEGSRLHTAGTLCPRSFYFFPSHIELGPSQLCYKPCTVPASVPPSPPPRGCLHHDGCA